MSGGLLEKAKQVTGEDDVDVDAAADAVIEIETVPNPLTFPLMKYVAIGTLLLSMILIYLLSYLPDFSGFVVLVIFFASFGAAWMHVKNERNGGIKPNPLQITALSLIHI